MTYVLNLVLQKMGIKEIVIIDQLGKIVVHANYHPLYLLANPNLTSHFSLLIWELANTLYVKEKNSNKRHIYNN